MSQHKWYAGLPVFIVLILAAGACAQQAAPQQETPKGEIAIGIMDDYSGPMAGMCIADGEGRADCIKYINEERGGILGHPLRAVIIDHKSDGTLVISGWDRLKEAGVPVVTSITGAAVAVLHASCERDHIPIMAGGGSMDQLFPKEPSYYFCAAPEYYGVFESLCDVIQKDWAERGKTGVPRVGFDIVSFGTYQKIFTKASRMAVEKRGWDYTITYTSVSPADVTTQVLQMKDFKCDYIYLMTPESAVIVWLKDLERQNFLPLVFGSTGLASPEIWNATGKLCVGSRFYQYSPVWAETDLPMVSLLHELNAKWHPELESRAGHYIRGFEHILVVAEALKRAIQNAGFDNLEGTIMKETMESMSDFQPTEKGTKYTWTPTDHQGVHGCKWYAWTEGGGQTEVSSWYTFQTLPEEQRTNAWWLKD